MINGYDKQEGLLFYLSADGSSTADFAKGQERRILSTVWK